MLGLAGEVYYTDVRTNVGTTKAIWEALRTCMSIAEVEALSKPLTCSLVPEPDGGSDQAQNIEFRSSPTSFVSLLPSRQNK